MNNLLFLIVGFLTDIVLGTFLGNSFAGVGISATPNVFLIVLILITFKNDIKSSLLISFFVGLTLDLFNVDTIFTYAIIYTLTTLIVSLWTTRINDSFIELFLVTLSAIFFKEVLVYILNISINGYILDISSWATNHLMFTLLLSLLPLAISVYVKLELIEKSIRDQRSSKKIDFLNYRY